MFISSVLGFIAIQTIALKVANGDPYCDDKNDNGPLNGCLCLEGEKPHSHMIVCRGDKLDDSGLDGINLLNETFYALIIQKTNLINIAQNAFIGSKFEQVFIENNEFLKSIADGAFDKGSVKNLVIRNNSKLEDVKIYDLATALSPKERIEFEGNNLNKVPDNAFGNNPSLNYIFLQNNSIQSIGNNAFENLPSLTQIGLNNNKLIKIESLKLSGKQKRKVSIFLHNNNLSETSFTDFKYEKQENVTIKLFLENNKFVSVPLALKSFLTDTKNELYFHNNEFKCDKDMKWVQSFPEQVFNVWCSNRDENINRVIL